VFFVDGVISGVGIWQFYSGYLALGPTDRWNKFPKLLLETRARPMYRHTDIYQPIWWCCRCIVLANFRRYTL